MSDSTEHARYTEGGMRQYEELLALQEKQLELIDKINEKQANRTFELLERGVKLRQLVNDGSYLGALKDLLSRKEAGDLSAAAGAARAAVTLAEQDLDPMGFAEDDSSMTLET